MLDPQYLIVNKPGSIIWTLGVTGLTDVTANIYQDGVEISESPLACQEHPTGGVYVGDLRLDDTGTYLIRWRGDGNNEQAEQNLFVVISAHSATIRVEDTEDGTAHAGVRVMLLEFANVGYDLISETTTDDNGECNLELPEGAYRICLEKSGYVFTVNGFELEIDYRDEEAPILLNTKTIPVPTSRYVAPQSLVTMTATLINGQGSPIRYREVLVTTLSKVAFSNNDTKFVVADDRTVVESDTNGQLSVELVPGTEVEVSVKNTSIIRRFTVPGADFDLFDNIDGADDYFTVQQPDYPDIPTS